MLAYRGSSSDMALGLVGIGSAIIDFAPATLGVPLSKVNSFTPSAGGAVSNLLVAASRLGLRTGLLGCVGDDEFGSLILRDFEQEGVDTSCVKRIKGRATGIAFYSVDGKGERHYAFYRLPGYSDPEAMLRPEDIEEEYIAQSRMLHFSESLLRRNETRDAVFKALKIAKDCDVSVSYDPNMRAELWEDKKGFLETQREALDLANIFLATLKEASLIVGRGAVDVTAERVLAFGPDIVVIRGKSFYQVATSSRSFRTPVFKVKVVDTSGAGDAFDAGFLTGLIREWPLERAVSLGSAVAALKVMKAGTRGGLPRMDEAAKFLEEQSKSSF